MQHTIEPAAQASLAMLAEARDFVPDLLAIQERPPARLSRLLLLCAVAFVAALVCWSALAKLDLVVTAEGRLVPMTFTKVVQPAEGGIVSEIHVNDGDAVREGQLLLRLDARLAQADARALGTDVALRRLTLKRIDAELGDRPFVPGAGERADLRAQVDSRFRARRDAWLAATAQETEALNRAHAELRAAQQTLTKLAQTLPIYQQSAQAYSKLLDEGFVGELAAAEKVREAIEKEQDLKAQSANLASLEAAIAQSRNRIATLRSQYRSQLEDERLETIAQLNRSGQEFEKSSVKAGMLDIRAPAAGVVKDLAVVSPGTVVSAGSILMNIVPVDEPLQAEVLLRNEDVGFIAAGQPARIKVAAYPFQKHGPARWQGALGRRRCERRKTGVARSACRAGISSDDSTRRRAPSRRRDRRSTGARTRHGGQRGDPAR